MRSAPRLKKLILAINEQTGKQVVILIDEYDKPILSNISDQARCKAILPVLKGFYSSIKKCATSIRLAMVTGVSKFCHVSLFSELNNLTDITLEADYAAMLGFTEEEVRRYFADRIDKAAKFKKVIHAAQSKRSSDNIKKLESRQDKARQSNNQTIKQPNNQNQTIKQPTNQTINFGII